MDATSLVKIKVPALTFRILDLNYAQNQLYFVEISHSIYDSFLFTHMRSFGVFGDVIRFKQQQQQQQKETAFNSRSIK